MDLISPHFFLFILGVFLGSLFIICSYVLRPLRVALLIATRVNGQHSGDLVALRLKRRLIEHHGYREKDIVVLLEDSEDLKLRPTKTNILMQMTSILQKVRPRDHITLYFTGHGAQRESYSGEEGDGLDEGFVGCDDEILWDNDIRGFFIRKLRRDVSLTAIIDCCHAGTILDLEHYRCNNSCSNFPLSEMGDPLWTPFCDGRCPENHAIRGPRILSFAAVLDGSTAWDGKDGQSTTSCILDILDEHPQGITWEDLSVELQNRTWAYQEDLRAHFKKYPEKFGDYRVSAQSPVFGGDRKLNLREKVDF